MEDKSWTNGYFISLVATRLATQRLRGRESMKLCADGVGLNSENEGNVGHWGKKPYALLKVNYVHFPCCYYFFKKNIIIFWGATVLFMLIVCSVEH